MQYPYPITWLVPLSTYRVESGDVNAVYDLPAPKTWQFTRLDYDPLTDSFENQREEFHQVTRVRVSLGVDEELPRLKRCFACVIPFFDGKEDFDGAVSFAGVRSYMGVLDRLGFRPILNRN